MKILIRIALGLVVLVAVGLAVAILAIDGLAKAAVERGGEYALGVETELGEADIGLFSGQFGLHQLRVANPEGFDSPAFFQIERAELELSMASLSSEQVEAPLLSLDGVELSIERKNGKTNYKEILEHLERFESGESKEPPEPGTRFVIREVVLTNVSAQVDVLPVGGSWSKQTVHIPEIRLENVGSGEDGASIAEVMALLVKAVLEATLKFGKDVIPGDLMDDLGRSVGKLGKGVKSSVEKIGKETGDALEDVGKKLEGVFKKP